MAHTPPTASRADYASAVVEGSDGRGRCHAQGGLDRKGVAEAVPAPSKPEQAFRQRSEKYHF
jgi:hypothetical protein